MIKTTDLKVGQTYKLRTGVSVTIQRIYGAGRNRGVTVDKPILKGSTSVYDTHVKIKRFVGLIEGNDV